MNAAQRQDPRLDLSGPRDDGDEAPRAGGAHDPQVPRSRTRTGLSKRLAKIAFFLQGVSPRRLNDCRDAAFQRNAALAPIRWLAVSGGFFVGPATRSARGF